MLENEGFKYVHLSIEKGVLVAVYKAGLQIDLEIAEEIVETRLKFVEYRPYPVLVDDRGVKSMSREARVFFSSEKSLEGVKAGAILSRTTFSELLINFFLKISRPSIPIQSFANKKKALQWLQQFR